MRSIRLALIAALALAWIAPAAAQDAGSEATPPAAQKKPEKKKRDPIYDEKADANAQIAAALAKAKTENRRVLIQWGANWCGWCYRLHDHFEKNKDVRRKLLYEYDLVLVDVGKGDKNLDLAKRYGADFMNKGLPFLTVLDGDGKVLANQETGSLETQDAEKPGHDGKKVLAFLTKHQATYLPAESLLSDALRRAKAEKKSVFLHFGAPWCGWCHRLEDWMTRPEVAAVLSKDFIDVKIDTDRTIGGEQMLEKMTKGVRSGIPWFAFLDADGNVIADSFAGENGGNLGCPYTDEEIDAFAKLLAGVTDRISNAEITKLADDLRRSRKKK
jgi:thiol-disulfide isomerase/thioredoxin